jgi:hypothetical protein
VWPLLELSLLTVLPETGALAGCFLPDVCLRAGVEAALELEAGLALALLPFRFLRLCPTEDISAAHSQAHTHQDKQL